jgi:hypothetical protein
LEGIAGGDGAGLEGWIAGLVRTSKVVSFLLKSRRFVSFLLCRKGMGAGEGAPDRRRQDQGLALECRTKNCPRFVLFSCRRYHESFASWSCDVAFRKPWRSPSTSSTISSLRAAEVARIVGAKLKVMPTSRPKSARSAAA